MRTIAQNERRFLCLAPTRGTWNATTKAPSSSTRLINGDKTDAVKMLKESAATGRKGKQSYRSASFELQRRNAP